eukprot:GHVS01019451.1.p1 GENE.GHVS01019451.1~~GHVS01019451.1.p1  ORF type:complete len:733 (-),score=155.19 GHVS01019451.1:810-3008(-)
MYVHSGFIKCLLCCYSTTTMVLLLLLLTVCVGAVTTSSPSSPSSPSSSSSPPSSSPSSSFPVHLRRRSLGSKNSSKQKLLNSPKHVDAVNTKLPAQAPLLPSRQNEFIIHYQDVCPHLPTQILLDADDATAAMAGRHALLQRYSLTQQLKDNHNKQKNGEHLLGGKITLSGGFFHKEYYNESDMRKFDQTDFALWRRHFLRGVSHVLGGMKLTSDSAKMTEQQRREFLEDQSKPTLLCGYLRSVQTDICHMHGLQDGLAELLRRHGSGGGGGPAVIMAALRHAAAQVYIGADLRKVLDSLSCVAAIDISVHNDVVGNSSTANLPTAGMYSKQWHLQKQANEPYALTAPKAWATVGDWEADASNGDVGPREGVVLAIIDTGCARHQDLWYDNKSDNKLSTIFWKNKGEYDCTDGIDNDGNGYIDDCWGFNFVDENPESWDDDVGHGTSVSAVAGAMGVDNTGTAGMYQDGWLMCLKAGNIDGLYSSDTIEALNYAIENGALVSNHSYGGVGYDPLEFRAMTTAQKQGHLIVTAAGNSSCDVDQQGKCYITPGAYILPNLLNVGASTSSGNKANFSCWGKVAVDIFAPGVNMLTASLSDSLQCHNCYAYVQGTSFSSPATAAACAMLWTHFRRTKPSGWTASTDPEYLRVKNALMYSPTGSSQIAGANQVNGVVNTAKALKYYDSGTPAVYSPQYPNPDESYEYEAYAASLTPPTLLFYLVTATLLLLGWSWGV